MQEVKLDTYRDGGTMKITRGEFVLHVDGRIGSPTKGHIFRGYPGWDSSTPISTEQDFLDFLAMIRRVPRKHKCNQILGEGVLFAERKLMSIRAERFNNRKKPHGKRKPNHPAPLREFLDDWENKGAEILCTPSESAVNWVIKSPEEGFILVLWERGQENFSVIPLRSTVVRRLAALFAEDGVL